MRQPSRVLYITYTSPVPAKIGPSRRHYHILDQLSRFYELHSLSMGKQWEADLFSDAFGNRVAGFDYAIVRPRAKLKFIRKVWRTLTARCDFLPPHRSDLRKL